MLTPAAGPHPQGQAVEAAQVRPRRLAGEAQRRRWRGGRGAKGAWLAICFSARLPPVCTLTCLTPSRLRRTSRNRRSRRACEGCSVWGTYGSFRRPSLASRTACNHHRISHPHHDYASGASRHFFSPFTYVTLSSSWPLASWASIAHFRLCTPSAKLVPAKPTSEAERCESGRGPGPTTRLCPRMTLRPRSRYS